MTTANRDRDMTYSVRTILSRAEKDLNIS